MPLFRTCLVSIWELLIFVCTFSVVSGEKCASDYPFIKTPVQLTELEGERNVYIIDPQATSFEINCSSTHPVFWNVFSKSAYENLTVTFHSEKTELTHNNVNYQEVLCHTVTLEFKQIDEGLTGLCICENIRYEGKSVDFPKIYIYGGTAQIKSIGNLINRGKVIKMSSEDYVKTIEDDFLLVIPCAINYPTGNRKVEILINKQTRTTQSEFRFTSVRVINGTAFEVLDDCPTVNCDYHDDCLDFEIISKSIKASEYLQDGMLINCYTTRDKPEDIVKIEVKKSPPIAHTPSRLNMTLNITNNEPLIFVCKSAKPISVTTNLKHGIIQNSQFLPNHRWPYLTEVKITTPSHYQFWLKREKQWKVIDVKITCAFTNDTFEQVTWNYKLLNVDSGGIEYKRNRYSIAPLEDLRNIFMPMKDGRFLCISNAPNTMAVKFVPCSTFNDCQIKSRLLFLSDSRFELSDFAVVNNRFEFRIPKNISGLVRCFGYDTDINGIVYVGIDFHRPHYLLSSEKQEEIWGDTNNPFVLSNVSEIFEGDYASVNCSIPLMLMVSHPQWEFTFRNETEGIIPDRYIMSFQVKAKDEMFFMAAEIQMPTLEVTGIACVNHQFATATPVEWSKGMLTRNSVTTKELRRESIPIKVKGKTRVLYEFQKLPPGVRSQNLETISESLGVSTLIKIAVNPPEDKNANQTVGTNLAVGFFGLVVLLVIIFSLIIRHIRRQQNIIDKLREEEIAIYKQGNLKMICDSESANKNAQNMPYDDNYEIDLINLNIDYKTCLGSGEYGMVYKATMGSNTSKPVAVKCVKPGASVNYIRAAMSELKVMMFIKFQDNVVKIIGACTQELISHRLVVVMEFCEKGDLRNYLRKHSEGFMSVVKHGKLIDNPSTASDPELKSSGILSTLDIFRWACQIANGMKYISSLKIIHGDLATRNVLLDSNFDAKISDFGLSKKLYEYSNYVRKNQTPLPWRWLAVESLTFTEFSIASDVWAYGITLWELFSLGGTPYPGQQFNSEFVNMISSGFRLPLPQYATYDMYNLMLMCWREMPAERPSFLEIHSKLEPASYEYHHL